MKPIKDRTVWVHINIPGQSAGAADLPSELALTSSHLLTSVRVSDQCRD